MSYTKQLQHFRSITADMIGALVAIETAIDNFERIAGIDFSDIPKIMDTPFPVTPPGPPPPPTNTNVNPSPMSMGEARRPDRNKGSQSQPHKPQYSEAQITRAVGEVNKFNRKETRP